MKHLIVGGTGTLGTELVDRLLADGHEVIVFSRDELKQQEMRKKYPFVRYVLGDIRDPRSINGIMQGVDTVFHVAALKHVDSGEANPVEFIKTNLLGTINVAESAIAYNVRHVVFSSTDKACLPINTYGMTKGLSERYLLSLNKSYGATKFAVYRWANVLGSRGSVIHSFVKSLKEDGIVHITDARMTRFWIHIKDAVDFMLRTYGSAPMDRPLIPPMRSARVVDIAECLASILGVKNYDVSFIGTRPGEKYHEVIESNHDYCVRSDTAEQFSRADLQELLARVIA